MKYYFLITVSLMLSLMVKAQQANIYALGVEEIGTQKGVEEGLIYGNEFFIRMNPYEGSEEILANVNGVQVAYTGSSMLQQSDNHFVFWGQESGNAATKRIAISVEDGKILDSKVSQNIPVDVQCNMRTNEVFALKNGTDSKDVELVSIQQHNFSKIKALENVRAVSVGNSAFDSNRGFYIFTGSDERYQERLYTVNTSNGNIVNSSKIRGFYYNELEFDVRDDKLYGLCRKKTNSAQFFFVEISSVTAKPTIVRPIPKLKNVLVGTAAIDQENGTYIFVGVEEDGQKYMYVIDLISGDYIAKKPINKRITELHCDNTAFATKHYGKVSADPSNTSFSSANTSTKVNYQPADIKSVDIYYDVEIDLEGVEGAKATITNLIGEEVFSKVLDTSTTEFIRIDLTELEAGIYLMKIKADGKLHTKKFMKR